MKRWFLALAVLIAIGSPVASLSQDPEINRMDISAFGEGWRYEVSDTNEPNFQPWTIRHAIFGPDGSRVLVLEYEIGTTITDRGKGWEAMRGYLSIYAGYQALDAARNDDFGVSSTSGLPSGVEDSMRNVSTDDYGEPVGYGIYAFTGSSVAAMVVVEGTIDGLFGVEAADFIVGLWAETKSR